MFKNLKTPHFNAGQHFFNMLIFFVAAAFLTLSFSGSISNVVGLLGGGLVIGAVGMVLGLGLTIVFRSAFTLVQTGRFLQYACFWVGTWTGIKLAASLFSSVVIGSPVLISFIIFAIAFGIATLSGEVPTKGRTWLPKRRPATR